MLVPAILIVLTLHELAHGLAAYLLGDDTAKMAGRLTFNPLSHIDIIGFICMLLAGIGWAKPVPISPYRFKMKNKKLGMAITALAGPAANFIVAFFCLGISLLIRLTLPMRFLLALAEFLDITAVLSIGLMAFNLLPVPPLDGFNVITPFLPNKVLEFVYKNQMYISIGFMILLFLDVLDGIIHTVVTFVYSGMYIILATIFSLIFYR